MDAEARFRALYAEAYGPLLRWAHHRGIRDADDLIADVFTIAWRRFADIPADAAIPWLYGVARNVARNHARALRRRAQLQLVAPREVVAPPPDEPADARMLLAALASLRDDDREVLRLVAWDGVAPAQLAALTAFELWVDDHDVVRGLHVVLEQHEQTYPGAVTRTVDGRKELDPATMGDPVIVTITSHYKVQFTDIGEPLVITAPAGAVEVAGKG